MKKISTLLIALCASLMASAADNLALNQPASAGFEATPAAEANDGNMGSRWGSSGAAHYAAVGEDAQDWWSVDLGGFYEIDSIRILFERANPSDYDLLLSNNGSVWTVIGTYDTESKFGNNPATDYNVYTFTGKVGRYVKIFARNGYNGLQYGISIYEFEVYGKPATLDDTNPPTLTKAELSGTPEWNQVKIAVAATDPEDGAVSAFHVVDEANGLNKGMTAVAGIITVDGLKGETAYHMSVTAVDNAGNESSAIVVNVTTPKDISVPQAAAPAPTHDAAWVRPVYSDAYESILKHDFVKQNWGSVTGEERAFGENHYLLYDMTAGNQVVWGENNAGNNAIVALDEYSAGGSTGDNTGIDASSMEYLHLDIFSLVAMENIEVRVNDQMVRRINLTDAGWQQIDVELAEPVEAINLTSVRWFKFTNITNANRQKLAFDNVYFWRTPIESDDEAPKDVTVQFVESDLFTVILSATATENNDAITYSVMLDGEKKATASGKSGEPASIQVGGLEAGKSYTFSVIATDLSGNAAEAKQVAATTQALPASAPASSEKAEDVVALYSDEFAPSVAVTNYREDWWHAPALHQLTIGEDDHVLYYDNVAANTSFGWAFAANVDATGYQKLHLHIYPMHAGTAEIYPVKAAGGNVTRTTATLTAGQWNEVVLDMTDAEFAPFMQLGFANFGTLGSFLLDNVYFIKAEQATAIDQVIEPMKAQKRIENGQVIIIRDGVRFNILGTRL